MRDDDDGHGQVDGDASPWAHFSRGMRGQPWMHGSEPPWHLWGNTQRIEFPIETTGAFRQGVTNQLIRVAYKRPETWHWIFQARLISGPNNTVGFFSRIFVHWELTVGIGRSMQRMHFENATTPGANFPIRAFEEYTYRWADPDPFPAGATIWSTQTTAPSRDFDAAGPFPAGPAVTEIVAQDIQLQVQVVGLTAVGNVAAVGQNAIIEVSAQFAPKTHVRPDWLQLEVEPEAQFTGQELGGR